MNKKKDQRKEEQVFFRGTIVIGGGTAKFGEVFARTGGEEIRIL